MQHPASWGRFLRSTFRSTDAPGFAGVSGERLHFLRHVRAASSTPGGGVDTSPQVGCCRATCGCCRGTTKKSSTYKISGAVERRTVPIRELVENKARRLKEKIGTRHNGKLGP